LAKTLGLPLVGLEFTVQQVAVPLDGIDELGELAQRGFGFRLRFRREANLVQ